MFWVLLSGNGHGYMILHFDATELQHALEICELFTYRCLSFCQGKDGWIFVFLKKADDDDSWESNIRSGKLETAESPD